MAHGWDRTLCKTNDGVAKMLIIFRSAGKMEIHFKEVSQGLFTKLSDEEKHTIRQQHGFEVVGPALTHENNFMYADFYNTKLN